MVAAFVGLEVTLATEAKTAQQAADRVGGDLMPHRAQRRRQLFRTLRQQRSLRISQRRRLDQAQEVAHQRGIGVGQPLATAARPPEPLVRRHPLIEFLQSPSNRTGGDARATAAIPPRPRIWTWLAANRRRARSSRAGRNISYWRRMVSSSIMPQRLPPPPKNCRPAVVHIQCAYFAESP